MDAWLQRLKQAYFLYKQKHSHCRNFGQNTFFSCSEQHASK